MAWPMRCNRTDAMGVALFGDANTTGLQAQAQAQTSQAQTSQAQAQTSQVLNLLADAEVYRMGPAMVDTAEVLAAAAAATRAERHTRRR